MNLIQKPIKRDEYLSNLDDLFTKLIVSGPRSQRVLEINSELFTQNSDSNDKRTNFINDLLKSTRHTNSQCKTNLNNYANNFGNGMNSASM